MKRHHFDYLDKEELARDSSNKKIAGVCSGIARYLDVPSLFVRIAAVIALCIIPQPTLIGYGLAYIILDDIPEDRTSDRYDDR